MLKEKLTEYYESEASWVKCDGKTFSLFFHAALQNDAIISPVEQFKMIAQCAKVLRQSISQHKKSYNFATDQFKEGAQENSVPKQEVKL